MFEKDNCKISFQYDIVDAKFKFRVKTLNNKADKLCVLSIDTQENVELVTAIHKFIELVNEK